MQKISIFVCSLPIIASIIGLSLTTEANFRFYTSTVFFSCSVIVQINFSI